MPVANKVFQFRVELLGVTPLIWRRIQLADTCTFWDLHMAIQGAFAWNDSHLHEFSVPGENNQVVSIGIPMQSDFGVEPALAGWDQPVGDHLSEKCARVTYCYDFGDNWQHEVILEDIVEAGRGKKYPCCTAGERAGPPDDCGGVRGYEELLEILADPEHEEYASSHRWAASMKGLRGKFDPEAFDEQRVRFADAAKRLKQVLAHMR